MKDLNYFPLDVESNIYTMTTLEFADKTSQLLVATLDCRIFCVTYNKFKPQTRDIEFTYIPNDAKIISIGALKRARDDFVIGITHSLAAGVQKSSQRTSTSSYSSYQRDHLGATGDYGKSTTYYFNIYANNSVIRDGKFELDYVAQGCQPIRLRYVPYHLYPTELITYQDANQTKRKPFWLLSGGDKCIHAFCEDRPYQSFNEVPIEDCFPELRNLPSITLWIDLMNLQNDDTLKFERLIALGLEDGSVKLYHSILSSESNKFELMKESTFDDYTTIIPSVRLFKTSPIEQSRLRKLNLENPKLSQVNLLAVSSTNTSLVFKNVQHNGLDLRQQLIESQRFDCAVTSSIGDTNFDGYNEILIGTHGRELLSYQYDVSSDCFKLAQVLELNHPVFAISIIDLTNDALNDVIIMLVDGILLLQASVEDALETCRRRLDKLMALS